MLGVERRKLLLQELHQRGALSIAEAEKTLRVSRMTIHRDIEELCAQGLARKVHGGVVAADGASGAGAWPPGLIDNKRRSAFAKPFSERQPVMTTAKKSIARNLIKSVGDSQTLILDASSTIYSFAQELIRKKATGELFIIAGGIPIFHDLFEKKDGVRVALHGGEPHPLTGSLVGPMAVASIKEIRADWAVISAAGLLEDESAVFETTPEEADIKRAYLDSARKSVLALDHSKLGISAPYKLTDLNRFEVIVTDEGIFEFKQGKLQRAKA